MRSPRAILADWIDPSDPRERSLRLEQLYLAARNSDSSLRQVPFIAAGIGAGLCLWSPPWPLIVWWCAVMATSLAMRRFLRPYVRKQIAPAALARASLAFFLVNLGTISTFAAVAPIAWRPGEPMAQALVMLVLSAAMASVSSITAPSRIIFCADMLPLTVIAAGTPLVMSGSDGAPLAVLALFFAVLMTDNAQGAYRLARSALTLNDENQALIERLRASDRAKSEFLANMSHELRTPLNAILGFSEVMKDEVLGAMENQTYRAYASDIHGSGQHLLGLVNDILDLAKIEAGRLELDEDVFAIDDIIAGTGPLFRVQAEHAGVTVKKDVRQSITIRWDQRSARQIAINLISNAIKFTPSGGAVTITSQMRSDGSAAVTIRDTGCGIPADQQAKIFEPFGQARHDVRVRARPEGTGLGLAIVRGLVDLQNGRIELDSAPGKGTAVTIVVPASRVVGAVDVRIAA